MYCRWQEKAKNILHVHVEKDEWSSVSPFVELEDFGNLDNPSFLEKAALISSENNNYHDKNILCLWLTHD